MPNGGHPPKAKSKNVSTQSKRRSFNPAFAGMPSSYKCRDLFSAHPHHERPSLGREGATGFSWKAYSCRELRLLVETWLQVDGRTTFQMTDAGGTKLHKNSNCARPQKRQDYLWWFLLLRLCCKDVQFNHASADFVSSRPPAIRHSPILMALTS